MDPRILMILGSAVAGYFMLNSDDDDGGISDPEPDEEPDPPSTVTMSEEAWNRLVSAIGNKPQVITAQQEGQLTRPEAEEIARETAKEIVENENPQANGHLETMIDEKLDAKLSTVEGDSDG